MSSRKGKLPETVTLRELCWLLGGLTAGRISQLKAEGVVQRVARDRYTLASVGKFCTTMRERGQGSSELSEARLQWVKERTRGHELVRLEREGKLVPADQVETTWLSVLMFVRTKLLALPSKLAVRLGLCTDIVERQKVLREAIDEVLVDFASTEVVIEPPAAA